MVSLLGFWVVLFCLGSIFNNGKQDNKNKKQPYVSRRQRLKEYNAIGLKEQLDMIYHNIDAWKAEIKKVKDAHPKGG